jgi:phosphoenolpyruvate-protein kinase (PTS system EI component)
VLVGLGVNQLSVDRSDPCVAAGLDLEPCRSVAIRALAAKTAAEVRALATDARG